MFVVGLTGGIGSGKTFVAQYFVQKGIAVIDADAIAKGLLHSHKEIQEIVYTCFGKTVFHPEGNINRQALREAIFANPEKRILFETYFHPLIRTALRKHILQAASAYVIAIVPLLLENRNALQVNRILVVDVPESIQIQRVMQRDQISYQQVKAIMQSQISRSERLAQADDIIDNSQDWDFVYRQLDLLHQIYLKIAPISSRNA